MYSDLLRAVLSDELEADPPRSHSSTGELNRLRRVMDKRGSRNDPGWALQSVADLLAYDAALVRLARRRWIVVKIESLDIPDQGRMHLEQILASKGVAVPVRSVPSDMTPAH